MEMVVSRVNQRDLFRSFDCRRPHWYGLKLQRLTLRTENHFYCVSTLFSTRVLEQICNHSRPASLMSGADPATTITMEVLVEWDVIVPVWIVLKGRVGAKYGPATLLIEQKDVGETTRKVIRYLPQRHVRA